MGVTRRDHALLPLIVLGGSLGTCGRALQEGAFPPSPGGWPWATFGANLAGALLLGLLLEALARTGPDTGWRRRARLTVGTGLLGGYTTYSTFAVEVSQLSREAPYLLGAAYAVTSVLLGLAAAAAGFAIARRFTPRRTVPGGQGPAS